MPATNLGLVPGLLCTQALWAPQLAAPAGDPGHGRSLADLSMDGDNRTKSSAKRPSTS